MAQKISWKSYSPTSGEAMDSGKYQDLDCLPNKPSPVDWTDEYFSRQILTASITKNVRPTQDDVKQYAKVFLNFYYSGHIHDKDLAESVTCLFYFLRINNKPFVDSNTLIGDTEWKAPVSPNGKIQTRPTTDYFMNGTGKAEKQKLTCKVSLSQSNRIITTTDVDNWYSTLWDNIDKVEVLYYIAFLAGISCRLVVKDPNSVENAIVTNSYDRFSSLFSMRPVVDFSSPPNSAFHAKWQETTKKMSPNANRILCTLIQTQLTAPEISRDDVSGLAKAMCLLSLGSIGLGLMSWAHKAAEAIRMTLAKFLSRMCIGPYKQSAMDVYNLLRFQNEHNQKTFMYARLFHEGAFQELSTKHCPEFAMACAAIALDAQDDDIWNIMQFSAYTRYVPQVCEFAFVFKEAFYTQVMCDEGSASGPAKLLARTYESAAREYRSQRVRGRLNREARETTPERPASSSESSSGDSNHESEGEAPDENE